MGRKRDRISNLIRIAEMEGEASPQNPIVELAGEGRVLIEHHRGVIAYSRECVRVRVAYGSVLVEGNMLEFRQMHRMQLIVVGKINRIVVERW